MLRFNPELQAVHVFESLHGSRNRATLVLARKLVRLNLLAVALLGEPFGAAVSSRPRRRTRFRAKPETSRPAPSSPIRDCAKAVRPAATVLTV